MTSEEATAPERHHAPREIGILPPAGVFAFAISNFVMGTVHFHTALDFCACVAAIGAQAGLHAIWCVFAPVSTTRKLIVGILVGLLWIAAWASGAAVFYYNEAPFPGMAWRPELSNPGHRWLAEVTPILLYLPLAILAIQSPLWVARHWFRWRLSHPAEDAQQYRVAQLKLRDIFIAMGPVARALSAARVSMSYDRSATPEVQSLVLLIPALAIAVVSWLTMLPTLVATLGTHLRWLIGVIAVALAVALVPLVGASYVVVTGVIFFAGLAGPLLYARSLGYRLYTGRR